MKKILIGALVILTGAVTLPFIFAGEEIAQDVKGTQTEETDSRFKPAEEAVFGEVTPEEEKKETVVYDDDKVTVFFSKVSNKGVELLIENKADRQITIQCDSIAINGFSVNEIMMSSEVAPKSKGRVIVRCNTSDFDKEVKTVSGALRIIDFENYENTFNANFSNVAVQ